MHSKEPWIYDPDRNTHDSCIHTTDAIEEYGYIGTDQGGIVGSSEWIWLSTEDGERIVACVNACVGISNEELIEKAKNLD